MYFKVKGKLVHFEILFLKKHFIHLIGLKGNAKKIYDYCLNENLDEYKDKIQVSKHMEIKLNCFTQAFNFYNKNALYGAYIGNFRHLKCDLLLGNVHYVLGLKLLNNNNLHIPVSLLQEDIRNKTQ